MAKGVSGYREFTGNYGMKLRIYYDEQYDVANNTSTVRISKIQQLSQSGNWGYYGWTYYYSGSISINGTAVLSMDSTRPTHRCTINSTDIWYDAAGDFSGSATVAHNADGKKSVTINIGTIYGYTGGGGGGGWSVSGSFEIDLTTIPRTSSGSFPGAITLGTAFSYSVSAASDSFTHKAYLSVGNSGGMQIGSPSAGSNSYTATLETFAGYISGSYAGGSFKLETYSGSQQIGSATYSTTIYVPNNGSTKPSISASISVDSGNVPSAFSGLCIAGYGKLKWSISASAKYGAGIAGYSGSLAGQSISAASGTSGVMANPGTAKLSATVTDTRGFQASTTSVAVTIYSYYPPTLNFSAHRGTTAGAVSEDSTSVYFSIFVGYDTVGGKNSISTTIYYREAGASSWIKWQTGKTTSFTAGTFDSLKSYEFQMVAQDTMGNKAIIVSSIPSAFVTFHAKDGGKAIGLGMYSQGDDRFDVAFQSHFHSTVDLEKDTAFHAALTSDGLNSGTKSRLRIVDLLTSADLGNPANLGLALKSWVLRVVKTYKGDRDTVYMGTANLLDKRYFIIYAANWAPTGGGFPGSSGGIAITFEGGLLFFDTIRGFHLNGKEY